MSDTPIFDQLARERGYNRMVAGGPTLRLRPSAFRSMGQTDKTVNAAPSAGNEDENAHTPETLPSAGLKWVARKHWEEPEEDVIVFQKPIPVTTLAELAKGTHQE